MRRQLLVSTATAAILSGVVFAAAQDMPRGGKQEGTMQNQGAQSAPRGEGQSRPGMSQGTQGQRTEGQRTEGQRSQGQPEQGKARQAQPKSDMSRDRQQTTGQGQRDHGKAKQQAQPKPDQDRGRQQTTGQGQRDQGKAKQQAQPKPDQDRGRQQTTGQGQRDQGNAKQAQPGSEQGADRTVGQGRQDGRQDTRDRASTQDRGDLNVEQRTRIRQTVFARSDLPRVDNVNFRVSVGTIVPTRVRFAPVPSEIVEIRPAFRGHQYFVVRDEIVIVDNRRRIVAVIPADSAGGSGPAVRGSRTDVFVDLSPDEIREVQQVLIQRGFSVEIDGRLGPRTRQALIAFQRREGLQATGRIDNRTISSLGVSVRSNQGGGGQQPSTTGRVGSDQGGGAAQQPAPSNQGAGEPQRNPNGQPQGRQSGEQQGGQNPSPTTGQGNRTDQSPANQGASAEQGGSNPDSRPAPSSGGASGSGSMPGAQQQKQQQK